MEEAVFDHTMKKQNPLPLYTQSYIAAHNNCFPPTDTDTDPDNKWVPFDSITNAYFAYSELFVLHSGAMMIASCELHYNKLYDTCEVHEVCVNESKKAIVNCL
jgi:hypothetical protein